LHEKPDILNLDIEIFNISFKNSSVSHNKEKHAFLSFLVHMIPNHYLEKKKFGDYKYNLSAGIDEKDKSQPQNRREFDAYISYSHYDITWVKEFHDNLESMGFILCLDEKILYSSLDIV
jgi:hypothetical protein